MATAAAKVKVDYERDSDGRLKHFVWLVIGPNTWGKGFDYMEAFKNAGKPKLYLVYVSADPWITVDGMGSFCYYLLDGARGEARKPYHLVAYRAQRGKRIELTVEDGSTHGVMGSGRHETLDGRYKTGLI